MAFKDANQLYRGQDFRAAVAKYNETIDLCRGSEPDCTDPKLNPAYFFLANSYDNQYRPARKGEPANDELLTKAIENYKKAAEVVDGTADEAASHGVSGGGVWSRQAE